MSLLAAAFTPREVEYPVYRGLDLSLSWRATTVAPPSVADALAVLHLAPEPEADGHRAALLAVARRWLRPRPASDLSAMTDAGLARALVGLVARSSGVTDADRTRAEAAGAEVVSGALADVDAVVLRLALTLGLSPVAVLSMPWPVFLAARSALPGVLAEAEIRAATAARVAQADSKGWQSYVGALRGVAGLGEPERAEGPGRYDANPAVWEGKGMTREEHEAARRATLDAFAAARLARTQAEA